MAAHASNSLLPHENTSVHTISNAESHGHSVQFYDDDAFLLDGLTRFIGSALGSGSAAVVIATKAHREGLSHRLHAHGLDVALAMAQGRYVTLDAAATLSKFMVNNWPDQKLFIKVVGRVLEQVAGSQQSDRPHIAAFGEMVALLWAEGKTEAAIRLEQLWNEIAQTHAFVLHCAYPLSQFSSQKDASLIARVCAEHEHVVPSESYTRLLTDEQRQLQIVMLQQKAESLQTLVKEREALTQALAGEVEDLNRLHEVSTRTAVMNLQQIMQDVVTSVASVHGTTMGLFSLADPGCNELTVGASLGFTAEFLRHIERVPAGKGGCGTCMQRRERVLIEDTETDENAAPYRELARMAGIRAGYSTPLLGRSGELLGVLSVYFSKPHKLSLREIRLTDLYARMAVNSIENARLYQSAQEEIQRREKVQAALIQSEKLASVGRLAATIAHEINNPLEAITNLLYLAKRDIANQARLTRHLDMADHELARVAHISRQTLGFYRDTSSPSAVNLADLLDDLLSLYARKLESRGIQVVRQYGCAMQIVTQTGELRQVFSNLIVNSADAMTSGGTLTLRVSKACEYGESRLSGVRVTIADSGSGIKPEHKKDVFEPFFTTKKDVGTGLGLWITRSLVQKHRGTIRLRSRAGSGTVCSIFLPQNAGR